MTQEFIETQKRALAIATVVALVFAAYFLRGYFMLIVVAAVTAYLFSPVFDWFLRRFSRGLSVTFTLGPIARLITRARERLWARRDRARKDAQRAMPKAAP